MDRLKTFEDRQVPVLRDEDGNLDEVYAKQAPETEMADAFAFSGRLLPLGCQREGQDNDGPRNQTFVDEQSGVVVRFSRKAAGELLQAVSDGRVDISRDGEFVGIFEIAQVVGKYATCRPVSEGRAREMTINSE